MWLKKTIYQHKIITRLWASGPKNNNRGLTTSNKINMECYIRSKSELCYNVQNSSPIPPGINRESTFCRIYGTNVTDSVGELLNKKSTHKELRSFI